MHTDTYIHTPVVRVGKQHHVRQQVLAFAEAAPATALTHMLLAPLPAVLLCCGQTAIAKVGLTAVAALFHVVAVVAVVMRLRQTTCRVRTLFRRRVHVRERSFVR